MRWRSFASVSPADPTSAHRRAALGVTLVLPWALVGQRARAGAQQNEPLADAVRGALAALIADTAPPQRKFERTEDRLAFIDWLAEMSRRLSSREPEYRNRVDLLRTLDYECTRAGLDRQMVLGLIQVESGFRRYAISPVGARGYMQVMPFWASLIGDGNARRLFEMRTNLRYGCVILRHYLDREQGDLFRALGRYNGSVGRPEYPQAVLAAWRGQWSYVARAKDGQ